MPDLLIHPGFPKTASTTLQTQIFDQRPEINFISPHQQVGLAHEQHQTGSMRLRHIVRGLDTDRLSDCKHDNGAARPAGNTNALVQLDCRHKGILNELCEPKRLNVFSDETLLMPYRCAISPDAIPERIRYLAKSSDLRCHVLIIVRNQVDLMYSFYAQKFPKLRAQAGSRSVGEYYFDHDGRLREDETTNAFDLNAAVKAWARSFGSGSVSVLVFEELGADPGRFAARLAEVLGISRHALQEALLPDRAHRVRTRQEGAYQVPMNDSLPAWLRPVRNSLLALLPEGLFRRLQSGVRHFRQRSVTVPGFDTRQKAAILEHYRQGNLEFAQTHEIDEDALIRYGYLSAWMGADNSRSRSCD